MTRNTYQDDYFKFKWFRNGNLHIEFKREDLLTELNRVGGEGQVKP